MGWAVFAISLFVYAITVEPTVSFWDSGEYIATSAKLQIAHPPGAPLFQMIGAFFAMFATEADQVAKWVNYSSVISAAFTILFLFWTITNVTRKLVVSNNDLTDNKAFMILSSGLVGSLAFTFSDSFWFNAGETEVYSMASLVLAILIWLGLRWTDELGHPRGNRWVLLIAFITGLTFGVQFMGFLAIPAIVLMYFFKRYKEISLKKFIIANAVAVAILMVVFKYSLTFMLTLFGWGEVFLVNTFGLPFNTGTIIIGLLVVSLFFLLLRYTRLRSLHKANTIILAVAFFFMGFSTWLMLPLRANSNVVVNEGNPDAARSLLSYYNREQYPSIDSPFFGSYYSQMFVPPGAPENDSPKYERDEALGKYVIVNHYEGATLAPNPDHVGFLPRMWSEQNAENYLEYFGSLDIAIKREYRSNTDLVETISGIEKAFASGEISAAQYVKGLNTFSEYIAVQPPTIWQNLKYLVSYQFGYLYGRYLMWNFTGRQNDIQGRYDGNGEWLSGIGFIDNARLGSQKNLPDDVLNNKGRNTYFFLPLVLGLMGLVFQLSKNRKQFWVFFVFFLFTGLAIQFYTNPVIFQPRERDYSLVGSFYVFALWIGLGVYALYDVLHKVRRQKLVTRAITVLCLAFVPALMAFDNWDDHDRSERYTARAAGKAYLDSIQKDTGGILFTIGDIDTFPLWYAQEIEDYRTDVRVVISGYLTFDWYIDQMKRKAYKSDPVPSQLTHNKYHYGTRDVIYYRSLPSVSEKRWNIKDFMNWVSSDHPQTKFKYLLESSGAPLEEYTDSILEMVYYPTNKIRIPVNKENVLKSGIVREEDANLIVDYIDIELPKSGLTKNRILMLDILANNDWKRPIYFSGGSFDDAEYLWMKDYLQLDGLAYKLVPIKTEYNGAFEMGRIDEELMYSIVTNWEWGNSGSPDIYHDPETRKHFGVIVRSTTGRLIEQLIAKDEINKAREVIDLVMANVPVDYYGYYLFLGPFLDGYYKTGETSKARSLFAKLILKYQDRLDYYSSIPLEEQYQQIEAIIADLESYRRIIGIVQDNHDVSVAEIESLEFEGYLEKFNHFIGD